MSGQVSRGSAGEYQADEWAGIARTSWRLSVRGAGRCREAQLASIRQMSGQVSRGSAGECQADEREGVSRLSWRLQNQKVEFSQGRGGKFLGCHVRFSAK